MNSLNLYEEKAKEKQGTRSDLNIVQKSAPSQLGKTRDTMAKLAGGKNSLTLPKSDKSINKVHTTDELAKLANDGGL